MEDEAAACTSIFSSDLPGGAPVICTAIARRLVQDGRRLEGKSPSARRAAHPSPWFCGAEQPGRLIHAAAGRPLPLVVPAKVGFVMDIHLSRYLLGAATTLTSTPPTSHACAPSLSMFNGLPTQCRASRTLVRHVPVAPLGPLSRLHAHAALRPQIRRLQTERFTAFTPPDPAKLAKPKPPRPSRRRRWPRRLLWLSAVIGAGYVVDRNWNASSITRSLRTFETGLIIGIDYKINFRKHPPFAKSVEEVHARNAERIFNLLRANGGLYLKIGQAIAMQSAILPPQFQKMFAKMFDDAPQNDWKEVERVIREDFGKSVEEVFGVSFTGEPGKGVMERAARASASVAQVHWARLADGREVAVKIQKREIAQQVGWDLWSFKWAASQRVMVNFR